MQMIESGVQLFSRLKEAEFCLRDLNLKLFDKGTPNPNEIIQITGEFADELLIDFLVRCVLPQDINSEWKNSGVVFINTTHHINVLKITSVMDSHLKKFNIKSRKSIIEKSLSYITILNCFNNEQIEVTFRSLDKIIQDRDNVNLLIVDDIISQFWITKQKIPKLSVEILCKQNLQLLKDIVKNLNIVVVFSHYQLNNQKKSMNLQVEYKIIGETLDDKKTHFIVFDNIRKTSKKVPFVLESLITFT